MTKEIELWVIDGNTSEIAVRLNGTMVSARLCVRQEQSGTKAWNKKTGKEIALPKNRYRLCDAEGKQELADDLEELGLLGKSYFVWNAFNSAEWHNTAISISGYYEDRFDVGEFLTDKEAIEAVEEIQSEHDNNASAALEDAGYSGDLGGDGPCYAAHLYRSEEDEDVRVEL